MTSKITCDQPRRREAMGFGDPQRRCPRGDLLGRGPSSNAQDELVDAPLVHDTEQPRTGAIEQAGDVNNGGATGKCSPTTARLNRSRRTSGTPLNDRVGYAHLGVVGA